MTAIALSLFTILLWSTLTLLSAGVSHLPAFLSAGIALSIGGLVGLAKVREWKVPALTLALGIGGIFGYHALFFLALRHAPAVEVNLLQYLWPLLIVVLSPLYLPGSRLGSHHLAGACLGLAGAALVISGGRFRLNLGHLPGYLLALGAALVWSSYSLLTKRVRPFATGAVGGFCLASGLLALGIHALERLAAPAVPAVAISPRDWLFLVLLGLGPMGLAFYTWDAALKRGDPRVIGALAYLTPLLSTLLLVLVGGRRLTALSGCAMGLIVAGAVAGSLDLFRRLPQNPGDAGGNGIGHGSRQHGLDPQPGQIAPPLRRQGADPADLDGDAGDVGEPAQGEGRDQPGLRT
jgi:drug/metabolite transporter (DMT)-like permease